MSFQQNLRSLRPLITRAALIVGVCVGGILWLQSYAEPTGNPDFKLAIDDASPPSAELSFTSEEEGYYYPEYFDETTQQWIPIPNNEQFLNAGEHKIFVQIPGDPPPKKLMLRMARVDQAVQPTIFPAVATACLANPVVTTCPAGPTHCVLVATTCPGVAPTACTGVVTVCPVGGIQVTSCPRQLTCYAHN